jgi:4a-hydroxytetrahydrobiopterin dehydratase
VLGVRACPSRFVGSRSEVPEAVVLGVRACPSRFVGSRSEVPEAVVLGVRACPSRFVGSRSEVPEAVVLGVRACPSGSLAPAPMSLRPPAQSDRARLRGMADVLSADEIASATAKLNDWSGDAAGIRRTVKLPTFPAAIAVVDQVAEVAEAMDHHPDIDIRWRTLTFVCATHSAGGVTDKDVELARRIDGIVAEAGA